MMITNKKKPEAMEVKHMNPDYKQQEAEAMKV